MVEDLDFIWRFLAELKKAEVDIIEEKLNDQEKAKQDEPERFQSSNS